MGRLSFIFLILGLIVSVGSLTTLKVQAIAKQSKKGKFLMPIFYISSTVVLVSLIALVVTYPN